MKGNPNAPVALSRRNSQPPEELIFQLQLEQFEHDEKYHREIARLNMHQRLNHMALHFAKYVGRLVDPSIDDESVKLTVTDTFIISLSCANILNIRLWDRIGDDAPVDLAGLGAQIAKSSDYPELTLDILIRRMAVATGHMAAATEKLDHIEDYPFRNVITESVADLAKGMLAFASVQEWDIVQLTRDRLRHVKEKSILHGYV